MRPERLRADLGGRLLDFAWAEWAQMGIPGSGRERSPWAQDPEALIVFTLEIARDDPRLFDLLLGWVATNESLLSVRRLRAMCGHPDDVRLLNATLEWRDRYRPRRKGGKPAPAMASADLEPLFRGLAGEVREPDPAFAAEGFSRPLLGPTTDASQPPMHDPISFAFKLRALLGVSVRAEVLRHLLTVKGEFVITQVLAGSAGYARRNVQEALGAMRRAGVVEVRTSSAHMHWGTDPERWVPLLGLEALPDHRDWPHLLAALRAVLRWLRRPGLDELSDYLLASQTRDLLEKLREDLQLAGVSVGDSPAPGAWGDLEAAVADALRLLSRPGDTPR